MTLINRFNAWLMLLFVFSIPVYGSAVAQENQPAIIKKVFPSVVSIITYTPDGKPLAQGSGFFINQQGDVITNRHVLEGAGRAEIKTASGKVYPLEAILADDEEGDLIRFSVKIPAQEAIPLSLSKSVPEVGEKVIVIGNLLGLEKTVADGIVSAVRDIPAFGKILQITAPISRGLSGSPVVNMEGEVLGVATFQRVEGQNLNFALPGERINRLTTSKAKTVAEWNAKLQAEGIPEAEGLFKKGLSYYLAEDYKKAIPYFEKAVQKNPLSAGAYFCLGTAYDYLGRYQEAVEAYKEVIRLKPDLAEAYCNLALAYAHLDRYQEAVKAYKQAIRVKPEYTEAHYDLGATYLILGDKGSAVEEYKILKDLDKEKANKLFNFIYK
jgi:Trypsin-like serine proteases, typically periplasmic, contain C-terminal PDZ domain